MTAPARLKALARGGHRPREHWTPDMQVRAERGGAHRHGDDAGGGVASLGAADQNGAARRIHYAVGVDPIHFESGYPELVSRPGGARGTAARAVVERAGGLRCCGA